MSHHRATLSSRLAVTALAAVALLATSSIVDPSYAASASPSSTAQRVVRRHHPAPSHFTHGRVDNPWFPLKPGTRYVYRGQGGRARVPRRADRDVPHQGRRRRHLSCGARPRLQRTGGLDRADATTGTPRPRAATVWYFGENTADARPAAATWSATRARSPRGSAVRRPASSCPHTRTSDRPTGRSSCVGRPRTSSQWCATAGTSDTPLVASQHALVTREFSPLEPGIVEHKYYVRDVGDVYDVSVRGEVAHARLVSLTHLPRR